MGEKIFPPFTVLIPAYNEEESIARCIDSVLLQTLPPDRVVLINDGSTDSTLEIMQLYREIFPERIVVINIERNTGNKALALRAAIPYIKGDVVFFTDADSELDSKAFEYMIQHFLDPEVGGVCGYVRSRKHNIITGVRELQYILGQEIHKKGQGVLNAVTVIPGPIGAVRRELFDPSIDTLTEDMDLTLSLLEKGYRIVYERRAIAWTSDPPNLRSYVNQTIRWFAGFFQNLTKHFRKMPRNVKIVVFLLAIESTTFSLLLDILLIYGLLFKDLLPFLIALLIETVPWGLISLYAVIKRRRRDLIKSVFLMPLIKVIDLHIWFYTMVKELLLRRRETSWRRADRIELTRTRMKRY